MSFAHNAVGLWINLENVLWIEYVNSAPNIQISLHGSTNVTLPTLYASVSDADDAVRKLLTGS